jgi:hypothetical protein
MSSSGSSADAGRRHERKPLRLEGRGTEDGPTRNRERRCLWRRANKHDAQSELSQVIRCKREGPTGAAPPPARDHARVDRESFRRVTDVVIRVADRPEPELDRASETHDDIGTDWTDLLHADLKPGLELSASEPGHADVVRGISGVWESRETDNEGHASDGSPLGRRRPCWPPLDSK